MRLRRMSTTCVLPIEYRSCYFEWEGTGMTQTYVSVFILSERVNDSSTPIVKYLVK